jgi:hypothetical protein
MAKRGTSLSLSSVRERGGEPVKQDVVLVASEDIETRRELAGARWDDVPFELASSPRKRRTGSLCSGRSAVFVVLDFERRARALVMDALREREDLDVQLLLMHDLRRTASPTTRWWSTSAARQWPTTCTGWSAARAPRRAEPASAGRRPG